jgi:hypothetical protein
LEKKKKGCGKSMSWQDPGLIIKTVELLEAGLSKVL